MTETFYEELTKKYNAYVDSFKDADGVLAVMMKLKLDHTHRVVEDARRVMAAPVVEGIMLMAADRPPFQSLRDGPSTVFWVAV